MVGMETSGVRGGEGVLVGGAPNEDKSNLSEYFNGLDEPRAVNEKTELISALNCLPDKPEEPIPSDCCGSGCSPCVYDIYHEELLLWKQLKAMDLEEREQFLEQRSKIAKKRAGGTALSPVQFRKFKVMGIKQMSRDSFLYTFALPGDQALGAGIGQHAVLRERDDEMGVVTRSYTPISPSDHKGSFDILIKNYEEGTMTKMVKKWTLNYETEWKGPFGGLCYTPNQYEKIGMLACGTGIAPMVQVMRYILDNEDDFTMIRILYSCRTQHDILVKDFLDEYSSFWNVQVTYVLTRSRPESISVDKGFVRYSDRVEFGRIDKKLVGREMPLPSSKALVLVCGTHSFEEDMIKYLTSLGHEREAIFKF